MSISFKKRGTVLSGLLIISETTRASIVLETEQRLALTSIKNSFVYSYEYELVRFNAFQSFVHRLFLLLLFKLRF